MRYRGAEELDEGAIGQRVTVRRRLPEGGSSDTVGVLLAIEADQVLVRDKHGTEVTVRRTDIIACRVIRPPTPRARPAG